jgi:hypothetical protein
MTDSGVTATNIQRFNKTSDTPEQYSLTSGANFPLNDGKDCNGFLVKVSSDSNYIVVGSHNPAAECELIASDGGATSLSGTQRYSHPYHAVNNTAADLLFAYQPEITNVQEWDRKTDTNTQYSLTTGANFDLVPGKSYLIKVGFDVTLTPEHY